MLDTLRGRLIVSYLGVVLPALLLATGIYLILGLKYRADDADRQLSTGLYLVAPQIENVLVRERVRAASETVQSALLQITQAALQQQLDAARRTQVLTASNQIRTDLLQIDNALTPGAAAPRFRLAVTLADIRAQVGSIQAAMPASPPLAEIQQIRSALQQMAEPLGTSLTDADRQQMLQATAAIRGELQNTRFRLLIVRPDGQDGRVLLDSQTGTGNVTGTYIHLPAGLGPDDSANTPVAGSWRGDGGTWLYEAAPPAILVGRDATGQLNAPAARFIVLLAERQPSILDVVDDFVSRFLWVGIAALLLAVGLGLVLARSITRPLGRLATATHAVAAGNYAHQVPAAGSVEMRTLAADFNAMTTQVQRTQQAQRDFLANVSHDLKTPLTSIQGFSQAMLDGALRDKAAFVEAAAVINGEAVRMARLVGDLVDLVRLQSGESPMHKEPIDVPGLLQQTAAGMQPQATARHVELRVESAPLPRLAADPDRLRRAITNLVDNALRYTPPEGRVTLRAAPLPGAVQISVRDTGSGIPPDELPRIFERFYQVEKSRAHAGHGSGLGLAIVREIATAHGGDVAVQSRPGEGSEFTITLPT